MKKGVRGNGVVKQTGKVEWGLKNAYIQKKMRWKERIVKVVYLPKECKQTDRPSKFEACMHF